MSMPPEPSQPTQPTHLLKKRSLYWRVQRRALGGNRSRIKKSPQKPAQTRDICKHNRTKPWDEFQAQAMVNQTLETINANWIPGTFDPTAWRRFDDSISQAFWDQDLAAVKEACQEYRGSGGDASQQGCGQDN